MYVCYIHKGFFLKNWQFNMDKRNVYHAIRQSWMRNDNIIIGCDTTFLHYFISYEVTCELNFWINISFTLYHAYSRVGKGKVVLRHSINHFPPNFQGISCWVAELNAGLLTWCQSEVMKLLINDNSSSE